MTIISNGQVIKAAADGLGFARELALACGEKGANFPYFLACTILAKETHGRNIYGNDLNGALSGYPEEVDESNYKVFRWLVDVKGMRSNGVGPMQLTYTGFLVGPQSAPSVGLRPWIPRENIRYAIKYILAPDWRRLRRTGRSPRNAFWQVAKEYNGKVSYAEDAMGKAGHWLEVVGNDDCPDIRW